MDLERSWRRKIMQAAGAGIVAPAAIVAAAIAVGVGGGGLRGIGSIGQTLSGPEIPSAEAGAPVAAPTGSEDLLAQARRRESSVERAARRAARRQSQQRAQARRRAPIKRTAAGPLRSDATPTPTTAAPSRPVPSAAPAPTQPPSTVRRLSDEIRKVTDPIPVAGEPAGQVMDVIVETAEEVIPRGLLP